MKMTGISIDNTPISFVVGTIGAALITVISCSYLFRRKHEADRNVLRVGSDSSDPVPHISAVTETTKPTSGSSVNDVWEERRQRGIQAASLHTKKDITGKKEKPFGSSYYYAHNSTKTTGGYKDGLTMEDFTMNGPRLLSRNGAPILNVDLSIDPQHRPDSAGEGVDQRIISDPIADEQPHRRTITVTKYLWDDPGNKDGIATIRVDNVPSYKTNNHEITDWKEIRPFTTAVNASLTGEGKDKDGLYVKIEASVNMNVSDASTTPTGDSQRTVHVEYVLRIPKLYGHVLKVECSSKEKRLLIRLYKYSTMFDKGNLKAWPHPQKKIA